MKKTDEEKAQLNRLFDENNKRLSRSIKPLRSSVYATHHQWSYLEETLSGYERDYGGLELNPDFQRGHVWTKQQQQHFLENVLRKLVPESGFVVQFNCPNWENSGYRGDLPRGFQCIDGLQRLTAIRLFLLGKVKPFGLTPDDLMISSYSVKSVSFTMRFEVYDFQNKRDLLQHYLDINSGGTPHSPEEIKRVQLLLAESTKQTKARR